MIARRVPRYCLCVHVRVQVARVEAEQRCDESVGDLGPVHAAIDAPGLEPQRGADIHGDACPGARVPALGEDGVREGASGHRAELGTVHACVAADVADLHLAFGGADLVRELFGLEFGRGEIEIFLRGAGAHRSEQEALIYGLSELEFHLFDASHSLLLGLDRHGRAACRETVKKPRISLRGGGAHTRPRRTGCERGGRLQGSGGLGPRPRRLRSWATRTASTFPDGRSSRRSSRLCACA